MAGLKSQGLWVAAKLKLPLSLLPSPRRQRPSAAHTAGSPGLAGT